MRGDFRPLTPMERQILQELVDGDDIFSDRNAYTVKTHLTNIFAKLDVHTRLAAVTKALNMGFVVWSGKNAIAAARS